MARLKKNMSKSKDKQTTLSVKKLIKQKTPLGYDYVQEDDGIFALTPKDSSLPLKFTKQVQLPKEIEGYKVTPENFHDILFITQKPFMFNDDKITVGNKTSKLSELLYMSPFAETKDGKIAIIPPKTMKSSNPITILIGGEKVDFYIERVPYPSLEVHKYKSYRPEYISLDIFSNLKDKTIKFNYKFEYRNFKYIDEILPKKNILQGLYLNDIKINNLEIVNPQPDKAVTNNEIENIEYQINLFEKLVELQKKLNVRFKNVTLSAEDMLNAKKLYCSLVKEDYYSYGINLKKSFKLKYDTVTPEILNLINSKDPKIYAWQEGKQINLMGCQIEFIEVKYSTNVVFENLNELDKTIEYRFINGGKELYKIFLKPEELDKHLIDEVIQNPRIINIKNFNWDFTENII